MGNSCLFTVYKTVNQVNQKFYIGVHKTENPRDDYLGSGVLILRAIAKYGKVNFQKEILFSFPTSSEAFQKEEELVALETQNPNCYNMRKGGEGGFDFINRSGKSGQKLGARRAGAKLQEWYAGNPEAQRARSARARQLCTLNRKRGLVIKKGDSLSEEIKQKLHDSLSGKRNPAFGHIWISHPGLKKRRHIPAADLEIWVANGWQKGGFYQKKTDHSSYGRMWISQDGKSVFIRADELESYLAKGWTRGRVTGLPSRSKRTLQQHDYSMCDNPSHGSAAVGT